MGPQDIVLSEFEGVAEGIVLMMISGRDEGEEGEGRGEEGLYYYCWVMVE